ncbi:MAG: hypothetical protein AVDCRST_MAG25-3474, partial [uncultured Rubrobacteraceae bacterium]
EPVRRAAGARDQVCRVAHSARVAVRTILGGGAPGVADRRGSSRAVCFRREGAYHARGRGGGRPGCCAGARHRGRRARASVVVLPRGYTRADRSGRGFEYIEGYREGKSFAQVRFMGAWL